MRSWTFVFVFELMLLVYAGSRTFDDKEIFNFRKGLHDKLKWGDNEMTMPYDLQSSKQAKLAKIIAVRSTTLTCHWYITILESQLIFR